MPDLPGLFRSGETCECVVEETLARVLVDGAAYYSELRTALESAHHSIYIAGWDFDENTRLTPDRTGDPGALRELLMRRTHDLDVHILVWDMSYLMSWGRRFSPIFGAPFRGARRVHLHYDDRYPLGGSHHQKFVVVDDDVAFVGGIDLTAGRWDTRAHVPDDPRRVDQYGRAHAPFHDLQVRVGGEAARGLGVLFRRRWEQACAVALEAPPVTHHPWPEEVGLDLDVEQLALSLTDVADPERPVTQIEALYLETIQRARDVIYIENQYLTSVSITGALVARLEEFGGPEVLVVGPRQPSGWLEEATVGMLRWRRIEELRQADHEDRFRLMYPMASVGRDVATYVHAKLMILDDWFVRVGSANISQRSMGLDTELDCAMCVAPVSRPRVMELRDGLIAEHLGYELEAWREVRGRHVRLCDAMDAAMGHHDRTLVPFGAAPALAETQLAVDGTVLFDPTEPIELAALAEAILGRRAKERLRERLPHSFGSVVALYAIFAAWRYDWMQVGTEFELFRRWLEVAASSPLGVLGLTVGAASACAWGVPIVVLVVVLVVSEGAMLGWGMSMGAVLLAAPIDYVVGWGLGRHRVRRLLGLRVNDVSQQMLRRGALTFATLQAMPGVAFPVIGLVAGGARARFDYFWGGTLLGSLFYISLATMYALALRWFLEAPGLATGSILLGAMAGLWWWMQWLVLALRRRRVEGKVTNA